LGLIDRLLDRSGIRGNVDRPLSASQFGTEQDERR